MTEVSWRLLFAVALAAVALAAWADRTRNLIDLRTNDIAACERGNLIRQNQKAIVNVLLPTARKFARTGASHDVREYLETQIPRLERARDNANPVDCKNAND